MELLIKHIKVVDSSSPYNGQVVDIFIQHERITQIGASLSIPNVEVWEYEGACVSPGWVDIGTQTGDPGFEHKEDLESVANAAARGGFTHIATASTTAPVVHSKSEVLYIINSTRQYLVDFHPIGALTQKNNGKDLAELYEMSEVGAVAFSDSFHAIQHSGLLMRGLLYTKAFDGLVMNQPLDEQIAAGGYVHEGEHSTLFGMKGIPAFAESMMIQRDLAILAHTDSKLHFSNISAKKSVELIRKAKTDGLSVTASVNPMNLFFVDTILDDFDSNYRVRPPLRGAEDRAALIAGLADGTIDCIVSNHRPQDTESKRLELDYADDGVIMLETAFAVAQMATADHLSLSKLIDSITLHPRQLLKLPAVTIAENQLADLTLFHPTAAWEYTASSIQSKSKNSPFIGKILKGKPLGVIANGQIALASAQLF